MLGFIMKYILQIPASLGIGGLEKVARDIGLNADPNKYKVHYIVFGERIGEYESEVIAYGCKVFHLPEPSLNYHDFLNKLRQIMHATNYHAVHAHTMFNIGLIMMVAKEMKIPVRVSHAHSALDNGGGFKTKIYESAMRYLISKCATDFVACGDKAGIRLYGEKAYQMKGRLILNGIDTMRFRFNNDCRMKIRSRLGLEQKFVIGHTGHLAAVKNQKFLIELMPEILKRKSNAVLMLLGDGPDKQMLKDLVKAKKLQDYVIMIGNVSNVYDYLSAMDVFTFPSLFEGMPLSIIEVQANGLPCILSTGVPKDVYLTDLIHPLELSAADEWIRTICSVRRDHAEQFAEFLYKSGFDTKSAMEKIYSIYERPL